MNMRCYADNVLIELLPHETSTQSGILLVRTRGDKATEHRRGRVIASGPGRHTKLGAFIPNEVKPGDVVIVSALCGDKTNWSDFDVGDAPRSNEENAVHDAIDGERGRFRVIRQEEVLAVIEESAAA